MERFRFGADLLFTNLRQYDVPTKMLRFMDNGHYNRTPASTTLAFQEALQWCEQYAGGAPAKSVSNAK